MSDAIPSKPRTSYVMGKFVIRKNKIGTRWPFVYIVAVTSSVQTQLLQDVHLVSAMSFQGPFFLVEHTDLCCDRIGRTRKLECLWQLKVKVDCGSRQYGRMCNIFNAIS